MKHIFAILLAVMPPVQAPKPPVKADEAPVVAPVPAPPPAVPTDPKPVVAPKPPKEIEYKIKKVDIYIIVDKKDFRTVSLQNEMTKDWTKRINPVLLKEWDAKTIAEVMARMREFNKQADYIRKHFEFHWIDYYKIVGHSDLPKMKFGRYGSWQKLPDSMAMCESPSWTPFFEWLVDEWNYPLRKEQWEQRCWRIKKDHQESEEKRRIEFLKDYVKKNPKYSIRGTNTWGLFKKKENDGDGADENGYPYGWDIWVSIHKLGWEPRPIPTLPKEPSKPGPCPVKGFQLK